MHLKNRRWRWWAFTPVCVGILAVSNEGYERLKPVMRPKSNPSIFLRIGLRLTDFVFDIPLAWYLVRCQIQCHCPTFSCSLYGPSFLGTSRTITRFGGYQILLRTPSLSIKFRIVKNRWNQLGNRKRKSLWANQFSIRFVWLLCP